MAKIDLYKRWELIVRELKKNPLSYEELSEKLNSHPEMDQEELKFSLRTFPRDIVGIAKNFNIIIEYNRGQKVYEITSEYHEPKHERLMEAYSILNVLNQSNSQNDIIFLDDKKSKGTDHFNGIIHAIKNKLIIEFLHHSYWNNEIKDRECLPIAIKEAQNRWYLFAYDALEKKFKIYGLDRISDFTLTTKSYKNAPSINITDYFKDAYGIVTTEEAVKVTIAFDISQINYVRSLPFHPSQKITKETKTTFWIELFIQPTYDFRMELLKYGNLCEVIEPVDFRSQMREIFVKGVKRYRK